MPVQFNFAMVENHFSGRKIKRKKSIAMETEKKRGKFFLLQEFYVLWKNLVVEKLCESFEDFNGGLEGFVG